MLTYLADELLNLNNKHTAPNRAARKVIFDLRIWKPITPRKHDSMTTSHITTKAANRTHPENKRGRDPVSRPAPTPTLKLTDNTQCTEPSEITAPIQVNAGKTQPLITYKRMTSIGTWNVRTMYSTGATRLLLHELSRFKWDVVGLSETHWTGIQEVIVDGYMIISSGMEDKHQAGVAIVLSKFAQKCLMCYRAINDRLIMVRLKTKTGAISIFQIYAPTADADDNSIDQFYNTLQSEINNAPKSDAVIVMGDFNAKVGSGEIADSTVMGPHGLGVRNSRGDRLIDFCFTNDLFIANTKFKQSKPSRSWTWESPDRNTLNQIDFILISKRFLVNLQNCRVFPSADCGSDHQLILANLQLKLSRKQHSEKVKLLNRKGLEEPNVQTAYHKMIEDKWEPILNHSPCTIEDSWSLFKNTVNSTSEAILGFADRGKRPEWISPKTIELADERRRLKSLRRLHPDHAKQHNYLCRAVKRSAKQDKDKLIQSVCQEIEEARTQNKTNLIYKGIRKITNKYSSQPKAIKDRDGKILTEPDLVCSRWQDYFDQLYNDPNPVDEQYIKELSGVCNIEEIPPISEQEIELAISKAKKRKAPGIDNISLEEIECATRGNGLKVLHKLFNEIWSQEQLPTDWKRSVIIPLHKKKDKLDCSNYRGISLLCHCSKLFSSIILRRIRSKAEDILSEAQCGFRAGRSTIDQIFTLRQLAEKHEEFSKDLYICYIDYRKAFDSIWRRGLWRVMRHYGFPEKIIKILESAYEDTFAAVRIGGRLSDWFQTVVGVLQGCVLSPLLFNIFLEIIFIESLKDEEEGVLIGGSWISNLRFADDAALLALSPKKLQDMTDRITEVSKGLGMKINATKTEIQQFGRNHKCFDISINQQNLTQTDTFVYLGGALSSNEGSDADVNRRISIARAIFQSLNTVWSAKDISNQTKTRVLESLVLNCLLYNSETWTLKKTSENRLRVFEMSCLRKIAGVTRRDKIRNTDIQKRLNWSTDTCARIQHRRLQYFGHVSRMGCSRYPSIAMNGRVHGTRQKGRPKRRWLDTVKEDCKALGLTIHDAHRLSQDRSAWRHVIDESLQRASASP